MRIFVLCIQLIVFCLAQEYYDRRYDFFDIDTLVQNPRLLQKYMNCFLDKGPCPPVGRVFKRALPEIIRTRCSRCTARQRGFVKKAFAAFRQYLPESHAELKRKLDPENKYYDAFESALCVFVQKYEK